MLSSVPTGTSVSPTKACSDREVQFPAFPVRPIDTNGAGDVFHGGFIYSLFQNWSVQRCLLFAGAAASLSCTRVGARASIPPLDEVLSLLKAHPPER